MNNLKKTWNALKDDDKIKFIEKVIPYCDPIRQIEGEMIADGQINNMVKLFINSVDWAQGIKLEEVCIHDKTCVVNGESELGNSYEGVGHYSDDTLIFIEDLELINH